MPKGSKAALWNLAFFNLDMRGDVLTPYEFAVMQLTRLGPSVACGEHTVSTDSVVLLQLRRIRNI